MKTNAEISNPRSRRSQKGLTHCIMRWWMVGSYITLGFVFSTFAVAAGPSAQVAARRNIVFILVDDLRWDDLGCTGNSVVRTPNIDRISREGMTFREAFATTPL